MTDVRVSRSTWLLPVGLVLLALALLVGGNFVQPHDLSGEGASSEILPMGLLAVVAVVSAVSLAGTERRSQVVVGSCLAALDAALVACSVTLEGFRFVWMASELQLVVLEVLLGVVALLLWWKPSGGSESAHPPLGWRLILYVITFVLLMLVALYAGTLVFEAVECDNGGECDLAFVGGLEAAAGTAVLWLVGVVACEVGFGVRRRRSRS